MQENKMRSTQGALEKQGEFRAGPASSLVAMVKDKPWSRRHFVLAGALAYYYETPAGNPAARGAIYLPGASVTPCKDGNRPFCVKLVSCAPRKPDGPLMPKPGSSEWLLDCFDGAAQQRWIGALTAAASGGNAGPDAGAPVAQAMPMDGQQPVAQAMPMDGQQQMQQPPMQGAPVAQAMPMDGQMQM